MMSRKYERFTAILFVVILLSAFFSSCEKTSTEPDEQGEIVDISHLPL